MKRLPLGFSDFEQLARCRADLTVALKREDAGATLAMIIGSSTTGWSMKEGTAPFSAASDIDVVVYSLGLLKKMMQAKGVPDRETVFMGEYVWLANDGPNGVLEACEHLAKFVASWSEELGRPMDLRVLLQSPKESRAVGVMLDCNPIVLLDGADE